MSAAIYDRVFQGRFALSNALLAAGPAAFAGVCLSGITLSIFVWGALIVPLHHPAFTELSFLAAFPVGAAAALALWSGYARYFSQRTGVLYERALRYDAFSWVAFLGLWCTFVLPLWLTHGGTRLFVYCFLAFCLVKLAIAVRFNTTVRDVTIDYIVTRFAIVVIAELAAVIIGQRAGVHVQESRNLLLAVWGRWDAVHYIDIATIGYHGTDMAFFPMYPLLIAGLGKLIGNHLIAGLVISNVALFFALLFLYKLVEHEYDRHVARRTIFYISIFPTAVFFSAVYPESLFLMLTVASFYYMRERRWWLAAFIGFFATLTRVEGILLVVPYAIEWVSAHWDEVRSMQVSREAWFKLAPVVFIPFGLALYMACLWVINGDPLYFSHVQSNWNRHLAPPWTAIYNSFHKIAVATGSQTVANQILELSFTALMIGVLIAGFRRLRPSYIAYMGLSILLPLCTSSLMSMPRFALVLFPMFAIFGLWGARPSANNAIVAFSLPLLGLFTVLFADWYWVS